MGERAEYETNLRSAYAVIAGQEQVIEAQHVAMRSATRQIELFLEDGKRERLTVALGSLDLADPMANEPDFVLEFDYRSDNGPHHVGPFPSREAAFDWAYRAIGGGTASYCAYPLTDPQAPPETPEATR